MRGARCGVRLGKEPGGRTVISDFIERRTQNTERRKTGIGVSEYRCVGEWEKNRLTRGRGDVGECAVRRAEGGEKPSDTETSRLWRDRLRTRGERSVFGGRCSVKSRVRTRVRARTRFAGKGTRGEEQGGGRKGSTLYPGARRKNGAHLDHSV